jgi:hypothetical protein
MIKDTSNQNIQNFKNVYNILSDIHNKGNNNMFNNV